MVAVPGGSEELVAESKDEDVLDHLLSKVVINTEDLLFLPVWCESLLKLARAAKVLAEWLLNLYFTREIASKTTSASVKSLQ